MFVAADAIVELSWYTEGQAGQDYLAFARTLLEAAQAHYLFDAAENDAVLRNGTVTYPLAGVSIVYGDYYLLSAKMKLDQGPPRSEGGGSGVGLVL